MKTTCGSRAIVVQSHILDLTTTVFSNLVQQKPVDRTADAKSKHTCVWMFLHFRNNLHVVADFPVGHEANNADMALRVGRIQGGLDCLHHLCSPCAGSRIQKGLRFLQVLSVSGDWLGKKYVRIAGKSDQIKGIGGI